MSNKFLFMAVLKHAEWTKINIEKHMYSAWYEMVNFLKLWY
jgi:hypothetical protein